MLLNSSPTQINPLLQSIIDANLLKPALDLGQREKKCLRTELVVIGHDLCGGASHGTALLLGELIETLHTGSLIIDDIQDNSSVRRNGPCIHKTYGVPLAINAGNWLYFSAYHQIGLSNQLTDQQKLQCYKSISKVMYWAHVGQAIDIGTNLENLSPSEIQQVCEKSLLMKSGYLTGLAFQLGAIAANASIENQENMFTTGCQFGLLLQKFDDVGNIKLKSISKKDLEDLVLMRPSWIWSCAHTLLTPDEIIEFKNAVQQLPEITSLEQILKQTSLCQKAYQLVLNEFDLWLQNVKNDFNLSDLSDVYTKLNSTGIKLKNAYI